MQALDTATELTRFRDGAPAPTPSAARPLWLAGQVRGGRRRATRADVLVPAQLGAGPGLAHPGGDRRQPAGGPSRLPGRRDRPGRAAVRRRRRAHRVLARPPADARARQPERGQPRAGPAPRATTPPRVRLIVTANYDAGRTGLVYRNWLRVPVARLKRLAGPASPRAGWAGWSSRWCGCWWWPCCATAAATGTPIGVVQLIPTAALVLALALLLELAGAPFGPAAGDNGAGAAVAISLVRALDAAPPPRLDVELVLQGAGEAGMTGPAAPPALAAPRAARHRHDRAGHRRCGLRAAPVVGLGRPARAAALPRAAAPARRPGAATGGRAAPHRGRGTSPALPARTRRLPALTIGCLDGRGLAPRSHQAGDTAGGA